MVIVFAMEINNFMIAMICDEIYFAVVSFDVILFFLHIKKISLKEDKN